MRNKINYLVIAYSSKKKDGFHCVGKSDWRKCYAYNVSKKDANDLILKVFNDVTNNNALSWRSALTKNIDGALEVFPTYYPMKGDTCGYTRGFIHNGVRYVVLEYWTDGKGKGLEGIAERCFRLDSKSKK